MHVHAEGFKPSHSQMLPLCCSGGLGCATHPLHPTNQGVSAAVGISGCSSDPAQRVVWLLDVSQPKLSSRVTQLG